MSCIVMNVWSAKGFKRVKDLEGTKFSSHARLAAMMRPGQTADVRETSGTWEGYYRQVGVDADGKNYWTSRPQTEI